MAVAATGTSLLKIEDIGVRFGGVKALDGLTFDIQRGHICALIGPNGAGKTTLFNVVSRLYQASSGKVTFGETDLLARPAHKIARLGIARTFQNLALVPGLSVLQNVQVGGHAVSSGGVIAGSLSLPSRKQEAILRERAMGLLQRLQLDHLAARPCAGLPFGTLKRIEIARALMLEPQLLMLDEPVAGMSAKERDQTADLLNRISQNRSVLVIEHDMEFVKKIAHKVTVLHQGKILAEGTMDKIQVDEKVIEVYLGH